MTRIMRVGTDLGGEATDPTVSVIQLFFLDGLLRTAINFQTPLQAVSAPSQNLSHSTFPMFPS